jgi:hypothetical protein
VFSRPTMLDLAQLLEPDNGPAFNGRPGADHS